MIKKPASCCARRLWTALLVMLLSSFFHSVGFAYIQVDSVQTTTSTCANNGSITVFASTNSPAILYSITAGPVTQGVQTNSQFNSLPAGTYTIQLTNAVGEITTTQATVSGNYIPPDFLPVGYAPHCPRGSDGWLAGNITAGAGIAPYTWELIAPSPITAAPQTNDTFTNLTAGNYTVRVTDACGSFRTIVATVPDLQANSLSILQQLSNISMVGCDTAIATFYVTSNARRFPMTFTFLTSNGSFTTTTPTRIDSTNMINEFYVQQLLPNFQFGSFVQVTITDACGTTTSSPYWYAQAFNFCTRTFADFRGCDYYSEINFDINTWPCYNYLDGLQTFAKAPLRYTITDLATNLVVAADTVDGYPFPTGYNTISGFTVSNLAGNKNYSISITDSCGHLFNNTFFYPDQTPLPPVVSGIQLTPDACNDSVGYAIINLGNFKPNPKIIFLSGPDSMQSTKPGYEHTNTHVYPDTATVYGHFAGAASDVFFISGLSVGKYYFKVIDSCGSEVFDSLEIKPTDVTNFSHRFWYKKGCLGQNEIHYSIQNPSGFMNITNTATGVTFPKWYSSQDFTQHIEDSLMNLAAGTYTIAFTYAGYLSSATASGNDINATPFTCQVIYDTITIEGYQTPSITAGNSILCHNTIHLELLPDSNKGVPPYQYEMIAGPQTFPTQSSNLFTVSSPGTYTARIYDTCGNASTTSITVDTLSFPPMQPIQPTCNSIRLTFGASPYVSYSWTGPNGQVYTNDTLSLNPITAADTGTYQIRRMIDINGCKDTFYTSYHLTFPLTYAQTQTICTGSSIVFGSNTYSSPGVYSDTLISSIGCDSIAVLYLTVVPAKRDSIVRNICAGQSISIGTSTYNSTGIYRDTLTTAGCDSIVVLNLTVNPIKRDSIVRNICAGQSISIGTSTYNSTGIYRDTLTTAGCDSIVVLNLTVNPIKRDSIVRNICAGQSISIGANTYNSTGIYRDTLATAGCDSIVVLNLTVNPIKRDSIVRTICAGQSISIGTSTYNSTGIYRDTLATTGCDSIVVLNLTVNPIKRDSIVRNICAGQSISIGTSTYNSTGIYRDTLATAGCDSIVVLNLTVNPIKRDSIVRTICAGQSISIGTSTYNTTGIYRDTLTTAGCDSIVVLNLTVNPIKRDSIVRNICAGQSISIGTSTYNSTGIYRDTLTTAGCDSIVVLNLTVNPIKRDSIVRNICAGQSFSIGTSTYNSTGIYRDTLATAGCDSIVVLNLTVFPNPSVQISATPTAIASGGTVQLNATVAPNYLWTSTTPINPNNIQNPTAVFNNSAWVYLLVTNNPGNCVATDSVFIRVIPDTAQPCGDNTYLYVPNAFTPNGNTLNDVFKIHSNNIQLVRFQIYNRWGEVVFTTTDIHAGWNGTYKGKQLAGNYVYMIVYYDCNRFQQKIMKGSVLLIH